MPTTSRLGYMLYISNHDLENEEIRKGGYNKNEFIQSEYINSLKEADKSKVYTDLVIKEILEDPLALIKPISMRLVNTLSYRPNPYIDDHRLTDWIMLVVWMPVILLFIISLRFIFLKNYWVLYAVIFYNIIFALPFWGTPRLRFPVDVLFIICAFIALDHLSKKYDWENRLLKK